MSWKPLPKGEFTGIDWSAPGAIDGMDPYLAWAEADGFMGYHVHGREPEKLKWLPIVIGLHEGVDVRQLVNATATRWLRVPRACATAARASRASSSATGAKTRLCARSSSASSWACRSNSFPWA